MNKPSVVVPAVLAVAVVTVAGCGSSKPLPLKATLSLPQHSAADLKKGGPGYEAAKQYTATGGNPALPQPGQPCVGGSRFPYLVVGASVVVATTKGETLATTKLAGGTVDPNLECQWTFGGTVKAASDYVVTVGGKVTLKVTQKDVRSGVMDLAIGT